MLVKGATEVLDVMCWFNKDLDTHHHIAKGAFMRSLILTLPSAAIFVYLVNFCVYTYTQAYINISAISQSGCNVRGHCSPKIFCLFCLMFNCIQIALLLGHIYVKLQSTVFHIKEIIEEHLRLHWRGYGRDNLFIYLKWISFCGKNISFVHILFLCYWN